MCNSQALRMGYLKDQIKLTANPVKMLDPRSAGKHLTNSLDYWSGTRQMNADTEKHNQKLRRMYGTDSDSAGQSSQDAAAGRKKTDRQRVIAGTEGLNLNRPLTILGGKSNV